MIYDGFTFFNELDILELRLMTLDPVVDRFVLVESTCTFTGHPKPLYFLENQERFQKYLPKINHVIVEDSPKPDSRDNVWNVEHFQRNAILRGLEEVTEKDRIIISDVDEIPHPLGVIEGSRSVSIFGFPLSLYYHYVNLKQNQVWNGSVMANWGMFPQEQREYRSSCGRYTKHRGWHFSFFGEVDSIQAKLAAFAETQVNTPETSDPEHIRSCLETGSDLFFRSESYAQKQWVYLDDSYPEPIHQWLKLHPQYYHEP